jgi:hypothetical protein
MNVRATMVMLVMMAGTGIVLGGPSDAGASCAGPEIAVTPTQGFPGSDVVVQGQHFLSACHDASAGGLPSDTNSSRMHVAIVFIEDGHRTPLGRVEVDRRDGFSLPVVVPVSAHPGSAQFAASPPAVVFSRPFTVIALPNGLSSPRSAAAIRFGLAALTLLTGSILFIGGYLILDRRARTGTARIVRSSDRS